jgi:hypothetical protein
MKTNPLVEMVRAVLLIPSRRPMRDVSTPPLAAITHTELDRDSSSSASARA